MKWSLWCRRAQHENLRVFAGAMLLMVMVLVAGCGPTTAVDRAAQSGQDAVIRCEEAYARTYVAFKQGTVTAAKKDVAQAFCRGAQGQAIQLGLLLRTAKVTGDVNLADPMTAKAVATHISSINQAAAQIAAIAVGGDA